MEMFDDDCGPTMASVLMSTAALGAACLIGYACGTSGQRRRALLKDHDGELRKRIDDDGEKGDGGLYTLKNMFYFLKSQFRNSSTDDEVGNVEDAKKNLTVVPKHIAVIMDGNRRYGRKMYGKGFEVRGHRAGGDLLFDFMGWCCDYGVEYLTVYAFSTENWNRPKAEVDGLMDVFVEQCPRIMRGCLDRGVRIKVIASDYELLSARVRKKFEELEEATKHCSMLVLNMCVSYGSRSEITNVMKSVARDVRSGKLEADGITEKVVGDRLQTRGMPDPDVVIRTSGEQRLSNYLLWQLAYSEMIFVKKHWPELTERDFIDILQQFSKRKRRYGK